MTLTPKQERQKAAQLGAARRATKRALALSLALLRADALRDAFDSAASAINDTDLARRQDDALSGTKAMLNTQAMRADALGTMHLAALYPVAEKWRKWGFADPRVDKLLSADHLKTLHRFRNAVFHAAPHDDKDYRSMLSKSGAFEWTAKLAAAMRDYLRRYHAHPATFAIAHITRNGW